jgi:hypothetical protein
MQGLLWCFMLMRPDRAARPQVATDQEDLLACRADVDTAQSLCQIHRTWKQTVQLQCCGETGCWESGDTRSVCAVFTIMVVIRRARGKGAFTSRPAFHRQSTREVTGFSQPIPICLSASRCESISNHMSSCGSDKCYQVRVSYYDQSHRRRPRQLTDAKNERAERL